MLTPPQMLCSLVAYYLSVALAAGIGLVGTWRERRAKRGKTPDQKLAGRLGRNFRGKERRQSEDTLDSSEV